MKVVAVIQARTGSTRLPGKVLKPIGKHPALYHTVRRTQAAVPDTRICIPHNDPVLFDAVKGWAPTVRGPATDVLYRYYMAVPDTPTVVVRITGDCPLVDPDVVREVVDRCVRGMAYSSNVFPTRTYPEGLDVEALRFGLLEAAVRSAAAQDYDREHVTPLIRRLAGTSVECVHQKPSYAHYRWTLDTAADYEFFTTLAKHLDFEPPHPTTAEVLALLEAHPEIARINTETAHAYGGA